MWEGGWLRIRTLQILSEGCAHVCVCTAVCFPLWDLSHQASLTPVLCKCWCCTYGSTLCLSVSSACGKGAFYIFCASQLVSRSVANWSSLMTVLLLWFSSAFAEFPLKFIMHWNSISHNKYLSVKHEHISGTTFLWKEKHLAGQTRGQLSTAGLFVSLFSQNTPSAYPELAVGPGLLPDICLTPSNSWVSIPWHVKWEFGSGKPENILDFTQIPSFI